ncbi:MAG TPA: DUF1992 domain-containing protein [Pedococcus sp.]|jgi:hypothetical protein|uniref:DnaJ family domain-containing protein n=1 Tax=Pedococcus sp. TaxID=2860345 RepID=UPI002F9253C2
MDQFESLVERQIREAQERGEFDNLPGAGKPLPGLDGTDDPDWWVKGLIRREGLDMADALPPVVALRREAAGFPESLLDLRTEASVREVLDDYNRRVRMDRLRPAVGPFPPMLARTVDVDDLVGQWLELRAARAAARLRPEAKAGTDAGTEARAEAGTSAGQSADGRTTRTRSAWGRWLVRLRRH